MTPDTHRMFFFSLCRDEFFEYVMLGAKGTKMPRGDKKQMMTFPICTNCNSTDLQLLQELASTIGTNHAENRQLARLRDTLLPKLMSGEIDVSKVDLTQLNSHLADKLHRYAKPGQRKWARVLNWQFVDSYAFLVAAFFAGSLLSSRLLRGGLLGRGLLRRRLAAGGPLLPCRGNPYSRRCATGRARLHHHHGRAAVLADLAGRGELAARRQRIAHTAVVVVRATDEALAALLALMRDQVAMTARLGAHGALPTLRSGS